jgi:hypothetical protein
MSVKTILEEVIDERRYKKHHLIPVNSYCYCKRVETIDGMAQLRWSERMRMCLVRTNGFPSVNLYLPHGGNIAKGNT